MASVIVLYTTPADSEGFATYYRDTHLPIVHQLPGLQSARASTISGTPRGTEAPYHLMAELVFATEEEMAAGLRSEAGSQVSRDAMEMCQRFGMRAEIMLADTFPAS